jgi:polysaccharide biosynthesis/export protein
MTRILVFLGVLGIFSACVPSKKLVYFQKDDLKNRKGIPKDTVLRSHPLNIREYRIQPLDLLNINFETISDDNDAFDFLSKISPNQRVGGNQATAGAVSGIMVDMEGNIEYPVLGKINVAGLNLFQAKDTIQAVASKYLPNVIVRVRMLNFRFTVLGEVNGEKVVTALNPRLTISEAIGQAGGLTEMADRTHVKIIRQKGLTTEVLYLNLLEEDMLESPNYYVQQNDVIIVPPLKQRTFRRYFTSNLSVITSTLSFALLIITLSTR